MRLYLGGHLDFYNPKAGGWLEVQLNQPTVLHDVLDQLGIPAGEVQLVVLNGELADLETTIVSNQDEVKLYSAVGGG
jgi:sulfur carrier protein ThiS